MKTYPFFKHALLNSIFLGALICVPVRAAELESKAQSAAAAAAAPAMRLEMKYHIKGIPLDAAALRRLESILGHQFKDKKLLVQALTSSEKDTASNYERFELLGDKILDAVLIQLLLHEYPDAQEGALSSARDALVSQEPMAALCLRLGLQDYVQHTEQKIPISTLCDVVESVIGALYEDGGEEVAQNFVLRCFLPMIKGRKCPQMMPNIIRIAAQEAHQDVNYVWKGDSCCQLVGKSGRGLVGSLYPIKEKDALKVAPKKKKDDSKRLVRYLAEREYVAKRLDPKYHQSVVRLAIDPDYAPLDKAPQLTLTWNLGKKENFRVRLHTLMQMLDHAAPDYIFQEGEDAAGTRFRCSLQTYLCNEVACSAGTKTEAAEAVAEITYKELQKKTLLAEDTDLDSKMLASLDMQKPISSLNEMCQACHIAGPTYTSYFKPKGDNAAFYIRVAAPWLMATIKGPVRATEQEAKMGAAARAAALLRHCSRGYIEPKKLQLLSVLRDPEEPIGILIRVCHSTGLAKPTIATRMCEGPVSDGIHYETRITINDRSWGTNPIIGEKGRSKADAEKDAAKKALNHIAHKMFKDELAAASA